MPKIKFYNDKKFLYLDQIDGLYISKPNDFYLSKGEVNDGINSNKVGLKGIPSISETIGITRDLSILEYVGGKIHFSGISTKNSVELISTLYVRYPSIKLSYKL